MYKIIITGGVVHTATGVCIHPDRSSVEWNAYRDWLHAGNVPLAPDAEAPTPKTPAEIGAEARLTSMAAATAELRTARAANPRIVGTAMIIRRMELLETVLFGEAE